MKKLYNRLAWIGKGYARAFIAFLLISVVLAIVYVVKMVLDFFGIPFLPWPPYKWMIANLAAVVVGGAFALFILIRTIILRQEQAKKPPEPPEE